MADEDVEKVWNEFWAPTIQGALGEQGFGSDSWTWWTSFANDGDVKLDPRAFAQIKRELFDFHSAMHVVPAVYSHATGGQLSRITYTSVPQITGAIDEHYTEVARDEFLDALLDTTDHWGDDPVVVEFTQDLLEAMEISLDEFSGYAKQRAAIAAMREKAQDGDSCTPL